MRYPDFIKEKATIGYVAPSFGCSTEPYKSAFLNAQKKFKQMGFGQKLGPNCYADCGIGISNTPQKCGEELNQYYCSNENDALISCGGGELMCEVVPYIDFEAIRLAKPKWFMGYSDNTNFTFLSAILSDTAAIYGPCAQTFGMEPWHPSLQDTMQLLQGKKTCMENYDKWEKESLKDENHPLVPYHCTEETIIRRFPDQDSEFSGRLIGGCLDCLATLVGTRFDHVKEFSEKYKEDGIIWFLEACDLNMVSIRRVLWQMKQAGWFTHVKGFLIGRPLHFGEEMFGLDQYRAVTEILEEYQVPILMDLDIGHVAPMMPIICGGSADIKNKGNQIQITYTFQ